MSTEPGKHPGQTHLNSDAKIADEGRPQGAPLPIVFSRRYALGRAPTRGAPTYCLLSALCPGEGAHKGRPYLLSSLGVMPWGGRPQGAPLPTALCPGEGAHKGRPYRLSSLQGGVMPWGGRPQGAPLPIVFSRRYALGRAPTRGAPIVFSRRYALGRAPTRGAPTDCLLSALCPGEGAHKGAPTYCGVMPYRPYLLSACPGEGAHKGRPYRLALCPGEGAHKGRIGVMPWGGHPQGAPLPIVFPGVMPWGGHPQGAPLPIVFSRRYALGRAPHKGRPYRYCPYLFLLRRYALGRAPTRGAPTYCGVMPWGGHPQGAPLPIVFSPALCPGEGTHKGRPYRLSSLGLCPGEGTHKGRPYLLSSGEGTHKGRVMPWGGHPQGAPLPIVFSRRYALGRAPTRGAPTRFRQPQVVLSQFDAIALGKHQGIGVSEKHLRSPHSGWLFCLVAN